MIKAILLLTDINNLKKETFSQTELTDDDYKLRQPFNLTELDSFNIERSFIK